MTEARKVWIGLLWDGMVHSGKDMVSSLALGGNQPISTTAG